jgi:hypothetical protein
MLRVKTAQRPGATTAKVESDDLINVSGGREARDSLRRGAEAAVLNKAEAVVPKKHG